MSGNRGRARHAKAAIVFSPALAGRLALGDATAPVQMLMGTIRPSTTTDDAWPALYLGLWRAVLWVRLKAPPSKPVPHMCDEAALHAGHTQHTGTG